MPPNPTRAVRIGNCSGFYGDRLSAARELLDGAEIDVLVGDWLAELTMVILHKARGGDPQAGWARTFEAVALDVLPLCAERGIKVVSNAGGLNPLGCQAAIERLAEQLGLRVIVAAVTGDDLIDRVDELRAGGEPLSRTSDGATLESDLVVANAYLGGRPIARALELGADVVVTGRCTDAALAVGPAMWWHGWAEGDFDRLAGAVVAGHVIECGAQATGGNLSAFAEYGPIGVPAFPIADIANDGSSVIRKGQGDGHVDIDTVTAQLLYEVGSHDYPNPDVTAHLDSVQLTACSEGVAITGIQGSTPPATLKVSGALEGGYRNQVLVGITGERAERKFAELDRSVRRSLPDDSLLDYRSELIGRPQPDAPGAAEAGCVGRIAVRASAREVVGRTFAGGVVELGLSTYPGFFSLLPPGDASECFRFWPTAVRSELVHPTVHIGTETLEVPPAAPQEPVGGRLAVAASEPKGRAFTESERQEVSLGRVLRARSGDKGGDVNIGLWATNEPTFDWLRSFLTTEELQRLLPETSALQVERYVLGNLRAVNFVVRAYLGEGVSSCLRVDAQAKGLGEQLLARRAPVPTELLVASPQPPVSQLNERR